MIKLVGTAIWICLITLASVYVSIQASSETAAEAPPGDFFGGLDYVRGDLISVPIIAEGEVTAYFLARLVFTAEPEKLAKLSIEPQDLITDELYSHLFGNDTIDLASQETFDLDAFRSGIRDALNARVGEEVFHEIIIEQIDYLTKEEIRSNVRRDHSAEAGPADEAAEAAVEGH